MGKAPDRAVSTTAPRRYVRCSTDVCLPTEAYTSTVAIGVRCKDTFHPLGTGTLFQADTGPVCVTAAHVVKQAQLGPGELCIRAKGSQLFAIQNNEIGEDDSHILLAPEPLDVAVIPLPRIVVDVLGKRALLHSSHVTADKGPSKGVYCLLGYPEHASGNSISIEDQTESVPLHFITYGYGGTTQGLGSYHQRFHLLLAWSPPHTRGRSKIHKEAASISQEVFVNFPEGLSGMSGCSVWKLASHRDCPDTASMGSQRIVALQTGLYPESRIVKATKWTVVLALLNGGIGDPV
ncbi:MAG: hypothetical protein JRH08_12630 [Deltaproteobacteria bacterium]|nr:hypothetical protein [Deltaproteobacteria bacterium]MBW1929621.1 hypothetical protein [Deltaproteobacteria bacterium]MBW2126512.1 hypothetical protein [Deltaproteobacteria bacterium]RLB21494.1 MAG: hypothetical protein DRG76_08850 [Deltaproteobacteria bacterium]